jgi:anti-sigma B factor antagonist
MTIRQRTIGDVVVLDVQGKIMGGAEAEVFQESVRALLAGGTRKLLVNMADVHWINSSGLGMLIAAFTELQKNGGRLKLVSVPSRIESLLAVTKLSTIFESFRQEDEAIQSFA